MYNINMSLTVKLPNKKKKDEYSLYVSSKITYLKSFKDLGSILMCEGSGIAFYSASNSRRAIVFTEIKESYNDIPLLEGNLPYIKQPVRILYKAKGRKVDLLKFMVYNLEKKYGDKIYELGELYWLKLVSYIDSVRQIKSHSGSYKRQVYLITDRFLKKDNLNEDI